MIGITLEIHFPYKIEFYNDIKSKIYEILPETLPLFINNVVVRSKVHILREEMLKLVKVIVESENPIVSTISSASPILILS